MQPLSTRDFRRILIIKPSSFGDVFVGFAFDGLADRVWEAAIDFLAECGVYNQSTNRVILHSREEIRRILKDASPEVLKIQEVNTGTFCFNNRLLFETIEQIGCDNAQGEYYLTDAVKILNSQGKTVPVEEAASPD